MQLSPFHKTRIRDSPIQQHNSSLPVLFNGLNIQDGKAEQ